MEAKEAIADIREFRGQGYQQGHIELEVNKREELGDVYLTELVSAKEEKYKPGMLVLSVEGQVSEVYYVDSYGNYFDELSGRQLDKDEVIRARLEEMRQFEEHKVYTKVPISQCIKETGKKPIQVRWLDINKGDEENLEYRSRLVAKEIKTDN